MIGEHAGANEGATSISQGTISENESVSNATAEDTTPTANAEQRTQATQQATPVWDGSQFSLKFRGSQVVPKTREELVNWAQLGYNAKQRMATLDERENALTEREGALAELAAINEKFEQAPEFKKAVFQLYRKFIAGGMSPAQAATAVGETADSGGDGMNGQAMAIIAELKKEVETLKGGLGKIDEKNANAEVKREIEALRSSHPDHEWDAIDPENGKTLMYELLEHASENGFRTLESAYRDKFWDTAAATIKANTLKEAQAQQQAARRAGIVSQGGSQVAGSGWEPQSVAGKSWDEVAQMALASGKSFTT